MKATLIYYVIFFILTLLSFFKVSRDYKKGDLLSKGSVILVWMTYLYQLALIVYWSMINKLYIPFPMPKIIGTIFICIGVLIIFISLRNFRSFNRMSGLQTDRLVTNGIYQFSRNSQNVGWIIVSFGISYIGCSGLALSLVVLFLIGLHIYIIFLEEPHLISLYGDEYKRYMASTPRYLGIPRRS